jgi:hypothetical protein
MLVMTTLATVSRVVLVAERRDTPAVRDPYAGHVRRYRLARLRLADRPAPRRAHEHLKRVYD